MLLLFLLPSLFKAQNTVSLQQALDQALRNNASLKAGTYELEYNKALKGTATDIGKTNVSLMLGQYNSLNRDNNLTISQSIPFPTVFGAQSQLNTANVKASELKLQMTKNELIYEIRSTYLYLEYLAEEKLLLQKQDSIYTSFMNAASNRYKSGESNLLEKTNAETELLQVKNLLGQNQGNSLIYVSRLQSLMNSRTPVQIETKTVSRREISLNADTNACAQNPYLLYLRQQIEISSKQKKLETARTMPDISLGYFNQTLIGYQNLNGTDQYFDASERFTGFQVGLAIPLWFVPHTAKIKAAELNKKAFESNYEQNQVALQNQYAQLVQEYFKSKNTLDYYEKSALPNADLIISQADKAFRNGNIAYMEYLHNVRTALNIRANYLSTLNQHNQNVIKLEFLTGSTK